MCLFCGSVIDCVCACFVGQLLIVCVCFVGQLLIALQCCEKDCLSVL